MYRQRYRKPEKTDKNDFSEIKDKKKAGGGQSISPEDLKELEKAFKTLKASDSQSRLNRFLTKELFDKLKTRVTSKGGTLMDVIRSGVVNLDSGSGIYACDAEAYTVFKELFDPIIDDYHNGFKSTDSHPPLDFGDVSGFENLDPEGEFVISTRIRCARSVAKYGLNPCMKEDDYLNLEKEVTESLSTLEGELKGTYYPLDGMSKDVQQQLIDDHFLFKEGDRFLEAANSNHYWPKGRGIFHNENKTFLVWVNEEDHLRIISMQQGADIREVYQRLVNAASQINKMIKFSRHPRFGYLTFCPTNLGTTIRASVHIKVPHLAENYDELVEIAKRYNLQVRGVHGEHSESEGGVFDISNSRRLGLTEFEAVQEMYDGIKEIIRLEAERGS